GDETLRARRGDQRRQLQGASLELEAIVGLAMLVTHSQADIGLVEILHDLGRKNVAFFIDIAEGWRNFARGIHGQKRQGAVAPDRRILSAVSKDVRVMKRDLGKLRHAQAELDPGFAAIEFILVMGRRNPKSGVGEKTAIAIVPT